MFDFIFESIISSHITAQSFLICSATAVFLGALIALFYKIAEKSGAGFLCALAVIPLISQTVIMMVSGSLGAGLAVAGAFSLIRFRSVPGTAREICNIFLAMTVGLACGMGYIGVACAVTALVEAVSFVFFALTHEGYEKCLKITVPETVNHEDAFTPVLEKHTENFELVSVRTIQMGTLYRLDYNLTLKKSTDVKGFIDELRCYNGNLDIICIKRERARDEM